MKKEYSLVYKFGGIYFHIYFTHQCNECGEPIEVFDYGPDFKEEGFCHKCNKKIKIAKDDMQPYSKDLEAFSHAFAKSGIIKIISDNLDIENENFKQCDFKSELKNAILAPRRYNGGKGTHGYSATIVIGNKVFDKWMDNHCKKIHKDKGILNIDENKYIEIGDIVDTQYGEGKVVGFQEFFGNKKEFVDVRLKIMDILENHEYDFMKFNNFPCDVKLIRKGD